MKFDLQLFNTLGTYDPKKVLVIFGGYEIKGYAEDSMITVKPLGDGIGSIVGCDGSVVRTIDNDARHEVTLHLNQASSSNDVLSVIHARDRSVGDGVLPLIIKDLSGRTTFIETQAWITNEPEVGRAKAQSDVEWTLNTAGGILFVGGHD